MIDKIKSKIENTLKAYALTVNLRFPFHEISPLLDKTIRNFILRPGKRARSTLFILGYFSYRHKEPAGLYRSAASLELLHNFLLIHDDIIDKAVLRKGQPTIHTALDDFLKDYPKIKFSGSDLSIIVGDIIYSLALNLFLSIKVKEGYKEKALDKFSEIVTYTGAGQFIEILYGIKGIRGMKLSDILKIYDLKSAQYTFSYPLVLGAALAGAGDSEINRLFEYGVQAGRAFQIKDDILDMFGKEKNTGKPGWTDIKEAKKTILLFYAYQKSSAKDKLYIEKLLKKTAPSQSDCLRIRGIVENSGALKSAQEQIELSLRKTKEISRTLDMSPPYRKVLNQYTEKLLSK